MEPDKIDWDAVLGALEQKRAVIDAGIAAIKIMKGDLEGSGAGAALSAMAQGATIGAKGPPHEDKLDSHAFFGMTVAAGAQKYLEIKKKPAAAVEIATALQDGGFVSQSDNFGSTVTTAMYRSSDTFVRVKRGLWGLKVWYPNYRAPD